MLISSKFLIFFRYDQKSLTNYEFTDKSTAPPGLDQQSTDKGNKSHPHSFLGENNWAGGQLGLGGHRLPFLPKPNPIVLRLSHTDLRPLASWSLWFPIVPVNFLLLVFYLAFPFSFTQLIHVKKKNVRYCKYVLFVCKYVHTYKLIGVG